MNSNLRLILCAVLAIALVILGTTAADIVRDWEQLRETERQLGESRSAWEGIAERKEELQAELKTVTEKLKEARLTLEESTARAEELRQDLAELQAEIEALKGTEAETDMMNGFGKER